MSCYVLSDSALRAVSYDDKTMLSVYCGRNQHVRVCVCVHVRVCVYECECVHRGLAQGLRGTSVVAQEKKH